MSSRGVNCSILSDKHHTPGSRLIIMNIHNSYFAIKNPLHILDRWFHPYKHTAQIDYEGKNLHIAWTNRAEQAFRKRNTPLYVEMQIYFTCVVQKRVLFHEQSKYPGHSVNEALNITLRPVQAESCDPIEFAKNHPVSHEYSSTAAQKLRPSTLQIDFKGGQWNGEFSI